MFISPSDETHGAVSFNLRPGTFQQQSEIPDQRKNGPCETGFIPSESSPPTAEEETRFTRQLFGLPLNNERPTATLESSHFVQKPVSCAEKENPREFQINQIRRRFNPEERHDAHGTHLTFNMKPSDPGFSHDLTGLDFILSVPTTYPAYGEPSLEVRSGDLDASKRKLVERKFRQVWKDVKSGSLLSCMNILDRHLANLLSAAPSLETYDPLTWERERLPPSTVSSDYWTGKSSKKGKMATRVLEIGDPQRRLKEVGQLKSRLGKHPLFREHSDGVSFTIAIKPFQPTQLPNALRNVQSITLTVPFNYPGEPCRIRIPEITDLSARLTEQAFYQHSLDNPGISLTAHINYLAATMHKMAYQKPIKAEIDLHIDLSAISLEGKPHDKYSPPSPPVEASRLTDVNAEAHSLEDRSHIHVIPRPPEWDVPDENDGEEADDEPAAEHPIHGGGGRKVLISCPALELQGVELLELKNLSLTLRCARCKQLQDMKNIKIGEDGYSNPHNRVESCQKCSNRLSAGFFRELMHNGSNRAGTLTLEGCTPADLLPSNFTPTCSKCSTTYPAPGVTAFQGDASLTFCRVCHQKMSFKLPDIKFLLVGDVQGKSDGRNELLGISAGNELPRRGACTHYSKSYRWFRFGCCSRVFPCDRCHDASSDHPNEHANRMICGFCSREQTYRPENCGLCRSLLVDKASTGFWEGGKGTRNKQLMNRKDPRKYKRPESAAPGPSRTR
ncbi:CHY zinc finger domain-containing protein [Nannizzia gypsea CBS 118893]|uniref:CHY zinc finger domain-containing protein n=1 Tax=Arthroderma gypseum (strain ATCC MYA-4604 / CBS 118893) TaxID=535722 RepID=E5R0Y9_ARTGP|nr:CHY zinc finger domain-containing protein [Nannizzia gypsea CBS 118893]EFQ98431.1 CHY zinc finger domain-containing protein [Nannizzia gypsea CBS 118893]